MSNKKELSNSEITKVKVINYTINRMGIPIGEISSGDIHNMELIDEDGAMTHDIMAEMCAQDYYKKTTYGSSKYKEDNIVDWPVTITLWGNGFSKIADYRSDYKSITVFNTNEIEQDLEI